MNGAFILEKVNSAMEGNSIKPINYNSVHKICSGQVVLTLATAVKELVENSIDAGATIIEVKLKEYGSELIEVIDNGKGVKESDFQSITLKHHTSKISDFSDVPFVSTFGFRGEALSSLCALSKVEITTCHCDSSVGTLLVFDHDGLLIKKTPTHRQVGTTITLKNLFFTLPVRHKEFHRNIRREYTKMLQILTAYCLISVNKKITCTNVTDKGRKTIVLATNSCDSFKDNISCIFGSKQVNNLMEFVQYSPSDCVLEEYFVPKLDIEKCNEIKIEGYISNSTHKEGRSSTDRQFYYINGRPCDLPKLSKLINEVYHSFNKAQYPFVFLNVNLTEGSADVNVTPDKRQIFIPNEKLLLCIMKTSLQQMYQLQPSEMKISSASLFFHKNKSDVSASSETQSCSKLKSLEEFSLKRKMDSICNLEENSSTPPVKNLCKENEKARLKESQDIQNSPDSDCLSSYTSLNTTTNAELKHVNLKQTNEQSHPVTKLNFTLTLPFNDDKASKIEPISKSGILKIRETLQNAYRRNSNAVAPDLSKVTNKSTRINATIHDKIENFFCKGSSRKISDSEIVEDFEITIPTSVESSSSDIESKFNCEEGKLGRESPSAEEEVFVDEIRLRKKKIKTISFSMETIKSNLEVKKKNNSDRSSYYRKFRSKIAPADNLAAEEELKKEIRKENFSDMDIIGQFNLGFIIARLRDDLFIIDQHATDEKYNFEMLQKQTVLETQQLLNPQNLKLMAVSEAILLDNLSVFEKSGFRFNINEENAVGSKVELVSVPVSHNWRFGKEDVDEMIFMLTDNPVSMIRPSRVNQMFASRACRKSVMIGTALTYSMMRKLVLHMGEIEQPWNCPHGRPTMRHLFNLKLLQPM